MAWVDDEVEAPDVAGVVVVGVWGTSVAIIVC